MFGEASGTSRGCVRTTVKYRKIRKTHRKLCGVKQQVDSITQPQGSTGFGYDGNEKNNTLIYQKDHMIYLSVTAHPDDEILGFGASTFMLTSKGHQVYNLILSGDVEARRNRPDSEALKAHAQRAQQIVGAEVPIFGLFPNIKFNTIPHLELVQFIEKYMEELQPDVVVTHHPYDLNNDHYHTSKACQAAVRLFQRKPLRPIKALYYMEVPSSTDWAFNINGQQFRPDTFIEIGELGLAKKIQAMNAYEGVMRPYPHPRSNDAIRALAVLRGSQAGRNFCEGFQTAMNVIQP